MQCSVFADHGVAHVIFMLRQLQEKYLNQKKRNTNFAYKEIGKAVDGVPLSILGWAKQKFGVDKGNIKVVKSVQSNTKSKARVNKHHTKLIKPWVSVY